MAMDEVHWARLTAEEIQAREEYFDHQMRRMADLIGLPG